MERSVIVLRCRRTGVYVLHPEGTFRGYGGYVGINPYREVAADASAAELGRAITALLALSGPTGVPIREAARYLRETEDDETTRIRRAHGLDRARVTTAVLARRFLDAVVSQRPRRHSWLIQLYRYVPERRSLSGEDTQPVRVSHRTGAEGLGLAVRVLLAGEDAG